MSIIIKTGYIATKNVTQAKDQLNRGSLLAAGVTAAGDLYLEVLSTEKKPYALTMNKEGTLLTHRCSQTSGLATESPPGNGICWHAAAALLALEKAYPETTMPSVPHKISIEVEFPERAYIQRDITPALTGKPGDYKYATFIPANAPAPEPETVSSVALAADSDWGKGLPPAVLEKVLRFREGRLVDMTPEQVSRIPRDVKYWAQGEELVQALSALVYGPDGQNWNPVLLKGPKGTGKSTLAFKIAEALCLPVNRISGSTDHCLDGLLGGKTLESGEIAYEEGLLLRAVTKGELLILEEVNVLRPDITSAIHPLLERRNRSLAVPGLGYIEPPASFRVVACMNVGYMGTSPLNEAFRDRFRPVNVPYASEKELTAIIAGETGCDQAIADRLAKVFDELKNRVASDDPVEEDVLSIRNLVRAAEEITDNPVKEVAIATSNISDGIDDEYTRKIVSDVVATIYGERR
jgi:MoxR-like ATPase